MIEVTYSVDMFRFNDALKKFWAYSTKSIGEITRAQARLFAVELANRTQPFGLDESAQNTGKMAVRRDVLSVFINGAAIQSDERHGLKKWLTDAIAAGKIDDARTAMRRLTGRTPEVSQDVVPSFHQSQRNGRGRIGSKPRQMLVLNGDSLQGYLASREKLVGFAKSGWAQAARDLGGTRGIPAWVTRNRGPGGAEDHTDSGSNPNVVLRNDVSYVSDVLPEAEIERAAQVQAAKMEKSIEKALEYEATRMAAS